MNRLGTPHVRLLVLSVFTDGTVLDKLGRQECVPVVLSVLNFVQDVLVRDSSKKVVGYFPDVHLTPSQRESDAVKGFVASVNRAVVAQFLKGATGVLRCWWYHLCGQPSSGVEVGASFCGQPKRHERG